MNKSIDRNYFLLFIDKILFINAMAFLSINTVISYFLYELGASNFVISLATILASIGALTTQPIFAKLAMRLPYKLKYFFRILLVQRVVFLIFVLLIPFIATKSPVVMVVVFLITWAAFSLFVGSYGPFFMSIMPKLISSEKRGKMSGYGMAAGSLIAMGTSVLIGKLLSDVIYPYNYVIIFGIGIFILFLDATLFHFMTGETPDPITNQNFGYFQYFKYIPKVLASNKKFATIVSGSALFVVANISITYYGIYAMRTYGAGAAEVAIFTAISMAVNIFANVFIGFFADKKGHLLILQFAAFCSVGAGFTILSAHHLIAVYVAFALSSLGLCGYQLSCSMLIIETAPSEELPLYISINSIVSLVTSIVVMLIASVVIDLVSFTPLYVVTFIAGIGAFLIFTRIKKRQQHIQ